ncbi:hypothetical protein SXIM_11130 [Streptomyces xiamenensis]|uniref:Uncharacterized protein n=1 Tax=Streptomyces xiamenensis TaxID=408015 RepID=A0A0F7FSE2_9ACTN|nr:hypothetical protein [Streptomyces xiamenensis]AKG42497.1 hypothetical protein SXIM_11130 [Streptomyces xiamenensis]
MPCRSLPYFNQAQAAQPAVPCSIETLRQQGVRVLTGPGLDHYTPYPPKQGLVSSRRLP